MNINEHTKPVCKIKIVQTIKNNQCAVSGVEIVKNLTAEELSERIIKFVVEVPPHFLFTSTEVMLEMFLCFLKYSGSKLHYTQFKTGAGKA